MPEIKNIYTAVLLECYKEQTREVFEEKDRIIAQINDYEKRISHARDLLTTQQIDAGDYRDMKSYYGDIIKRLELKLSAIETDSKDIRELLKRG